MEFNFDDVYHLYLMNRGYKSIVKLYRDYEWSWELVDGVYPYLGTLFSNMDIDEIVDSLRKDFDEVEIIDENEVDEYL